MRKIKKGLAMFLAVLMLVSSTPMVSFAEETINEDTVVYNLGNQEITVGYDAEQAEDTPWNYKLFDEDGNYHIQLEDNAFFPYEVQITSGSAITVEWFDTPDSTVQIGEHTLSVYSEQNDDTKLSQIGVWIDGEYIPARPEPKTFTNSQIEPASILPLEEKRVDLDLSSYNHFQLKDVKVSTILNDLDSSQEVDSSDKVVWRRLYYDDYEIVEQDDVLDFSGFTYSPFNLELIVGSALQLDDTNTRYIVGVTKNNELVAESTSIYKSVDGVRSEVTPINTSEYATTSNLYDEYMYHYLTKMDIASDTFHVGLTLNSAYENFGTVKAYEGSFDTVVAVETALASNPALDVTAKLLNQDMTQVGSGFDITAQAGNTWHEQIFTLVFEDGEAKYVHRIEVSITSNNDVYGFNALYAADSTRSIVSSTSRTYRSGVEIYTYTLGNEYLADMTHYLRLRYSYGGRVSDENRKYVTKAVVGHFNTEAEATREVDIKDDLFPINTSQAGSGYAANYSGNGQNFTIFAEGEVHKITIKAVDGLTESVDVPLPNPGSQDTNFRVTGAKELPGVYVLPYEHDTYYDMGYQTVFYTDDKGLSSLKPTFWKGQSVDVYSGHSGDAGTLQESGITVADFSNGPVQYAAAAENGVALKNYWVTFVKKHTGGAKLFVNGINGEDGAKREVFLTSIHDNAHDIFIANTGDTQLTGLTATLSNAQNVKLDPYWTVGGAGNDTLAAFDSAQKTTNYGELANVGKIRLLPDGEGEIKGTLTISATGQEPVVITLTGNAGNPRLTTAIIPEAVKYVPYAVQILHNNKYSWNTVTLEKISGSLPEGVILKPNGELYGVPKETGTFNFRVEMTNSDTRFDSSSAAYTLVVKENTNMNVDDATDIGYEVSQRLGTRDGEDDVITVIANHDFITDGEMGEFMGFWLNGEKLVENTDYTKEDGSTKITIRSQTFQNKAKKNSTNTIAAEFRVDGSENKELKRAAQNFKLNVKDSGGSGGGSGSGGSGGSGGGGGSTPKVDTPVDKTLPDETITTVTAADMKEALEKATSGVVRFTNKSGAKVKITQKDFAELAKMKDISLEIENKGIILTFTNQIINGINEQGKGGFIFHAGFMDKSNLTAAQREVVGDNPVVNLFVDSGGKRITNFNGDVKVSLPYKPKAGMNANAIVVYYVDANGDFQIIPNTDYDADTGRVVFGTNYLSTYMIGYNYVTFTDITNHWGKSAIEYVAARKLVSGTGNGKYDPDKSTTRAEFVSMIGNVLKLPDGSPDVMEYDDVVAGAWYYNTVMGAKSAGLLTGLTMDGNDFLPSQAITREEMAVIIANVVSYKGIAIPEQKVDITKFKDYSAIRNDYLDEIETVIKVGLMGSEGVGGGKFDPTGLTTRAQAAQVQKNILDMFK